MGEARLLPHFWFCAVYRVLNTRVLLISTPPRCPASSPRFPRRPQLRLAKLMRHPDANLPLDAHCPAKSHQCDNIQGLDGQMGRRALDALSVRPTLPSEVTAVTTYRDGNNRHLVRRTNGHPSVASAPLASCQQERRGMQLWCREPAGYKGLSSCPTAHYPPQRDPARLLGRLPPRGERSVQSPLDS